MVDISTFDDITLARLARELTMNVRNYKLTFADFGIDENDYLEIEKIEFFRKAKEQFTLEWHSAITTEERLKIGSLAYLERLLPTLMKRALLVEQPLPASTAVGNLLTRTAGIGDPKPAVNTAERFIITINLGADTEKYDKSIAPDPNDRDVVKITAGDSNGQELDRKSSKEDGEQGNGR